MNTIPLATSFNTPLLSLTTHQQAEEFCNEVENLTFTYDTSLLYMAEDHLLNSLLDLVDKEISDPLLAQTLLSSFSTSLCDLMVTSHNWLLIAAVVYNKVSLAQFLLTLPHIDVNLVTVCFGHSGTPLHFAARKEHAAIVEILLNHPDINPNQLDKAEFTPLFLARTPATIELLLAHPKIHINKRGYENQTPLYSACDLGDLYKVKRLLYHPQIDLNEGNGLDLGNGQNEVHSQRSPLHTASKIDILQLLLAHPKIDVNKLDYNSHSPLSLAASDQSFDKIGLLLTHPLIKVDNLIRWIRMDFVRSGSMLSCLEHRGYTSIIEVLKDCFGLDLHTARNLQLGPQQNVLKYILTKNVEANNQRIVNQWIVLKGIAHQRATLLSSRLFGLMVFLCDGLLALPKDLSFPPSPGARFFKIAEKLPLELQMILSQRTFDLSTDLILSQNSEQAFGDLTSFEFQEKPSTSQNSLWYWVTDLSTLKKVILTKAMDWLAHKLASSPEVNEEDTWEIFYTDPT